MQLLSRTLLHFLGDVLLQLLLGLVLLLLERKLVHLCLVGHRVEHKLKGQNYRINPEQTVDNVRLLLLEEQDEG